MREEYARLVELHLSEHFAEKAVPPRESFNRWMFSLSSAGLKNELCEDIPIKLPHAFPSQEEDQKKNCGIMAAALKQWMEKHESNEEALRWCEGVLACEGKAENNNELRRRARNVVQAKAEKAIDAVVSQLEKMRDKGPPSECADWEVETNFDSVKNRFVVSAVCDSQEAIFPINICSYVKCCQQFEAVQKLRLEAGDSGDVLTFEEALFCLLCRYDALCGPGELEGNGLQGTLPTAVYEILGTEITESFASPFNVWRPSAPSNAPRFFCSFFPEDRCFGSLGSFFNPEFEPTEGLFAANPPFDCEVMEQSIRRIEAWLTKASKEDKNLAFVLALPEWQPSTQYATSPIQDLLASSFLRATCVRRPQEHYYLRGRAWSTGGKASDELPKACKAVSKSRFTILASKDRENDGWSKLVEKLGKAWALK